jgi:hypothetical protein
VVDGEHHREGCLQGKVLFFEGAYGLRLVAARLQQLLQYGAGVVEVLELAKGNERMDLVVR